MIGGVGAREVMIVALAILVLFGASRLPRFGRDLGQSIRELRGATREARKAAQEAQDLEDEP